MKPLHIDPATIESQIGNKLNAARILGMGTSDVIADLEGHLHQAFFQWLHEFTSELYDRIEQGDSFALKEEHLVNENGSKRVTIVKRK